MPRIDDRLLEFVRTLRDRIPIRMPDWAAGNDSDPGITLVAVVDYLTEQLTTGVARVPAAGRAQLARIGARLVDLDRADERVDVRVDGERWRAVPSLDRVSAEDAVFVLDAATGRVQFGDGVRGARPPEGSTVAVRYRHGSGPSAGEVAVTTRWPPVHADWSVMLSSDGAVQFVPPPGGPVHGSGMKRVAYFSGQLLTADDFRVEQDYVRARLRRLNLAAFGPGVASGLDVSLPADPTDDTIVVSPGLAIDARGEEIEVPEAVPCRIPSGTQSAYVTLRFVERAADFTPAVGTSGDLQQPSRIEEGFALAIESGAEPDAVVLARVVRDGDAWRLTPET